MACPDGRRPPNEKDVVRRTVQIGGFGHDVISRAGQLRQENFDSA